MAGLEPANQPPRVGRGESTYRSLVPAYAGIANWVGGSSPPMVRLGMFDCVNPF